MTLAISIAMLTGLTSQAVANPNWNNLEQVTASQQSLFTNSPLRLRSIVQLPERQPPQSIPLALANFEVGGISVLFTEAQVRQRLGKPQEVTDENNIFGVRRYFDYNKNGIHGIYVIKDRDSKQFRFCSMLVNDAPTATREGVRVGDPRQKVIATYGNPARVWQQGDDADILYYKTATNSAELAFTVASGKVTEIQLRRIPKHNGPEAC